MPWYNDLRPVTDEKKIDYALVFPELTNTERKRIIQNLLDLRAALDAKIPAKESDSNLILASWNLKEFGHSKERLPESYFYIAEIINRFDLVAVQEVKSTLDGLNILMKLLGKNWGYLITDITEGREGNSERFAYLYDKRKVEPSGLSGEVVLWDDLTKNASIKQLKRTPAITGFRAGWKEFAILNVHLHPGNATKDKNYRKEEIDLLMRAIQAKLTKKRLWSDNLLMMGDTNLYSDDQASIQLITDLGFKESEGLMGKKTNMVETEIYDRIFLKVNPFFKLVKDAGGKEKGDVFKLYEHVYTTAQCKEYHSIMKKHKDNPSDLTTDDAFLKYYTQYWKKNQLSDHNPIWLEIEIDSSDDFLREKLTRF